MALDSAEMKGLVELQSLLGAITARYCCTAAAGVTAALVTRSAPIQSIKSSTTKQQIKGLTY